ADKWVSSFDGVEKSLSLVDEHVIAFNRPLLLDLPISVRSTLAEPPVRVQLDSDHPSLANKSRAVLVGCLVLIECVRGHHTAGVAAMPGQHMNGIFHLDPLEH